MKNIGTNIIEAKNKKALLTKCLTIPTFYSALTNKVLLLGFFILQTILGIYSEWQTNAWIFHSLLICECLGLVIIYFLGKRRLNMFLSLVNGLEPVFFLKLIHQLTDVSSDFNPADIKESSVVWKFLCCSILARGQMSPILTKPQQFFTNIVSSGYLFARFFSSGNISDKVLIFLNFIIIILDYSADFPPHTDGNDSGLLQRLKRESCLSSFLLDKSKNQLIIDPINLLDKKKTIESSLISLIARQTNEGELFFWFNILVYITLFSFNFFPSDFCLL